MIFMRDYIVLDVCRFINKWQKVSYIRCRYFHLFFSCNFSAAFFYFTFFSPDFAFGLIYFYFCMQFSRSELTNDTRWTYRYGIIIASTRCEHDALKKGWASVSKWKWLVGSRGAQSECEQPKMKLENKMEKNEILNHLLCLFTPLRRMDRIIQFFFWWWRICVGSFIRTMCARHFIYICTCWMNENHVEVAHTVENSCLNGSFKND